MKNNIIYEFLGNYWHGNPDMYLPSDMNELAHKTFAELYEHTFSRFQQLKQYGYDIHYIWENDWNMYKHNFTFTPKILNA